MDQYSYLSLQPGEIRLLKLLPAKYENEQIRCELLHVSLLSAPAYEAISYEWNSVPGTAWVEATTRILEISKTLEHALRGMRMKEKTRILWADGICVNQKSEKEVRSQLRMMEKVYELSRATLVWLGCSNPGTGPAIQVLHSLALFARQHNAHASMVKNDYAAFILNKRPKRSSVFISGDDMFLTEVHSEGECSITYLPRKLGLSDDNIFRFKHFKLWCEIDGLFSNSYFKRTWIEREVAKAPYVQLCRGRNVFSWPLFSSAFIGRSLMLFHPQHPKQRFTGPLHNVIDARERWRTPEHFTTLAGALVALSYSKETRIHDHIYGAYAMSKHTIPWLEQPITSIDIEKLMTRTACACIEERGDLYHLGQWCVTSRKRMNLPTWAPDFTSGNCELAVEYASESTSRLIDGSYNVCGEILCLDAHLLDSIEWSHIVEDCGDLENILKIVRGLEEIFQQQEGRGLFQEYVVSRDGWTPPKPPEASGQELLQQLSQAELILRQSSWYPESFLEHFSLVHEFVKRQSVPSACNKQLTIEALWSLLNPNSRIRKRPATCLGEHLFLAWLYLTSMQAQKQFSISCAKLPKAYGDLIFALIPIVMFNMKRSDANEVVDWTTKFIHEHLMQTKILQCETECIFVTKRGFLGRTVAGEARKGDVVSFLGGGWTPYILERREQFYRIKSFAYIEGLAEIRRKPTNLKIERISLQ